MKKYIAGISPYPTRLNSIQLNNYINLTKSDLCSKVNEFPIHLTELTLNEYLSSRKPYYRTEYNIDNTALNWILKVDILIVYDDFGIDDFMKEAIRIATEVNVKIEYSKFYQ